MSIDHTKFDTLRHVGAGATTSGYLAISMGITTRAALYRLHGCRDSGLVRQCGNHDWELTDRGKEEIYYHARCPPPTESTLLSVASGCGTAHAIADDLCEPLSTIKGRLTRCVDAGLLIWYEQDYSPQYIYRLSVGGVISIQAIEYWEARRANRQKQIYKGGLNG